jgi:ribose transport system permease protein
MQPIVGNLLKLLSIAGRRHGVLLVILASVVALFALTNERFLTQSQLVSLANEMPADLVLVCGMTLVLIVGGIDLSIGSVLALSGIVLAIGLQQQYGVVLSVIFALTVGLSCGLLNAAMVVLGRIPSFIATLGMLEIARGCAFRASGIKSMHVGDSLETWVQPLAFIHVSPAFLFAVLLVLIGQLFLDRTIWGRYSLAVGQNAQAVRYSGIDSRPVYALAFIVCGICASIAAIFTIAEIQSATSNYAVGRELKIIAAVVIGGTSLLGGRGNLINSVIGLLIVKVVERGLVHWGADEETKRIVTGSIIILAVLIDTWRNRGKIKQ